MERHCIRGCDLILQNVAMVSLKKNYLRLFSMDALRTRFVPK